MLPERPPDASDEVLAASLVSMSWTATECVYESLAAEKTLLFAPVYLMPALGSKYQVPCLVSVDSIGRAR